MLPTYLPPILLGTYYLRTYYLGTYYLGTYYLVTYYLGTFYLPRYVNGLNRKTFLAVDNLLTTALWTLQGSYLMGVSAKICSR